MTDFYWTILSYNNINIITHHCIKYFYHKNGVCPPLVISMIVSGRSRTNKNCKWAIMTNHLNPRISQNFPYLVRVLHICMYMYITCIKLSCTSLHTLSSWTSYSHPLSIKKMFNIYILIYNSLKSQYPFIPIFSLYHFIYIHGFFNPKNIFFDVLFNFLLEIF